MVEEVRRVDEAEVYVYTPFFNGKIKVICTQKPIYDLIIGNIPGVSYRKKQGK